MRNFKLVIEYDGTGFHGWQFQPSLRTVQGEIVQAIEKVTGERCRLVGAGRTDAGVHAAGQVANFVSRTLLATSTLLRAINANLPADIRILSAEEVSNDFDARFDAKSRTYHYIFIRRKTALWRRNYYPVEYPLDTFAMRAALSEILGEHDFSSFTTAEEQGTRVCRVISAQLIDSWPLLTVAMTADHFLNKMVRIMCGTVLAIGRGKSLSLREILDARDYSMSGPALPPYALYLMRVNY